MRRMSSLCWSVAALPLAGVLIGCASSPTFRPLTPLPADKAVVYIYRPSKMLGGWIPIALSVDGNKDVDIFSGDYHNLTLNPGPHFVALHDSKSPQDRVNFTAVAGQEHYVRVEPTLGGPKVAVVERNQGSAEIAPCHQPD